MRIISGQSGGIPITVPKTVLRPTADRVREAVFSILSDRIAEARIIDMFAGSGSYGLEALSRGAASATFVESERAASEVIRQNLAKARLAGGQVVCQRVEAYLRSSGAGEFDLIFADPPYKKSDQDRDWDAELLGHRGLAARLAPGGLFVLESFARRAIPEEDGIGWRLADQRRYGDSVLRFFFLDSHARPPEMETPTGTAGV